MKKHVYSLGLMLAATFTLTNCAQELDNPVYPGVEGAPFEILVSTPDTKTVNDGMATNWAKGDKLNVFHAVGENSEYTNNNAFEISDLEKGKFTGVLSETLDVEEEYDWFAFYPYDSHIETPANTNSGYMTVGSKAKESQTQNGNNSMAHIAGPNYPLSGFAIATPGKDVPVIPMSHVSSLLEINVTNNSDQPLNVTEVTFTAPDNIVGTYYIDFTKAIAPESFVGSGNDYVSKTAKLEVKDAEELASDESAKFYLAVKPFAAAAGDKLTINVNGYSKELSLEKSVEFTAGKIKKLNFSYDKVATSEPEGLVTTTISFTDNTQRIAYSSEEQVWENDGVVFSNTKSTSSNNVSDNVNPVRLYKGSQVAIEVPGYINKVVFNSAEGEYLGYLKELLPNASVSENIVTEVYDGSASCVRYSLTTGQLRMNNITVIYSTDGYIAPTLESLSLGGDYKTEFMVGDAFTFGGVVTAVYDNGSTRTVTDVCEFSGYDMDVAGEQKVTVKYEGISADYTINVAAKQDDEVIDVLNRATTGITATSYSNWTGKKVTSAAVYAGNSAGGNSSIQLRSTNSNSGVVTTTSGGYVKKIVITWQSATTDGRTLDVYGKNSAYSEASNLYSTSTQGTKLGSIIKGKSTTLEISGDYKYIGFRSNSGAMYLSEVAITWSSESGSGETPVEPVQLTMSDVNCTAQTENSLTFTWSAVNNASGYKVTCNNKTETVTDLTYTATGLNAGTEYEVSVVAVGDGANYSDSIAKKAKGTTTATAGGGNSESMTVSKNISDISGKPSDGTKVSTMILNDIITASASTSGSNNGKVYSSGAQWRLYQSDKGTVTISSASGYTIQTVKFTYTTSNSGVLMKGTTKITSGTKDTVNATSVTYIVGNTGTATNGQVRITAIEVVYQKD